MGRTLFTLGHSTRPVEELVDMLTGAGVRVLFDVRRFPGSRRNPQFSKSALAESIPAAGIRYEHVEALGGRRKTTADSPNGAWQNASFRGYADYMASEPFERAFERLLEAAAHEPSAMMCAEALPHRCHRRLIADLATLRGFRVVHLLTPTRSEPHRLHPDARPIDGGRRIVYPPA